MASDPKARMTTIAFSGGTVRMTLGLADFLFDVDKPTWGGGTTATTQLGRRRYKHGTRQLAAAAAGKEVFLDLGETGTYQVRVTGDIVDFVDAVVAKTGDKVKRIHTKRGTEYAPAFPALN